jgi:hypothetical protein
MLWDLFVNNNGRPIHKWKHYFPIYENHLMPFVNKSVLLIEIGVGRGGSLQMWKKFLGPAAIVVGIDVNKDCKNYEEDQIFIRIGSQDSPSFLKNIIEEFGTPDIVIDDGSHMMEHIETSFDFLYPKVSKNGVYMVEDLHTAYWSEYNGGLYEKKSFIEKSKRLIDHLNADHTRGKIEQSDFSRTTNSINFYDSVIVFQKGLHLIKDAPIYGKEIDE